jgi:NTE family protein
MMRALMLRRLSRPQQTLDGVLRHVERFGARFDGRLRVAAVDRASGRRVMFGSPGAPRASVAQAVTASCTVPWLFAPFEIAGREYVDGGVWSPTNLDAAPAGRETHLLCLMPTASLPGSAGPLAVVRRVSRSAVSLEALVLRRRGVAVRMVGPNIECAAAMGTNFMEREPRGRVLAAGYRQGLELGRGNGALEFPVR